MSNVIATSAPLCLERRTLRDLAYAMSLLLCEPLGEPRRVGTLHRGKHGHSRFGLHRIDVVDLVAWRSYSELLADHLGFPDAVVAHIRGDLAS